MSTETSWHTLFDVKFVSRETYATEFAAFEQAGPPDFREQSPPNFVKPSRPQIAVDVLLARR